MSGYYGIYLDTFESQEAWLCCVISSAYTTLLNKLLHNKLSKSAKHLNSTVTHCKCRRSFGGERSEVWRESSRRCELGLRPSGACWMVAQGGKAKEAWRELQG
jgi:hypothetical protein